MEKPPLAELEALAALAEAGSLTAAARALGISQPAVSQRLARLGQRLGTPVFIRRGRQVALTPAGKALLPLAREAARVLAHFPAAPPLVLGASQTAAAYYLPKRLRPLLREGLKIVLAVKNSDAVLADLAAGRLDAAVIEGPAAPPAGFFAHALAQDDLVLALPEGHPLLQKPRLRASDLDRLELVMREPGSGTRALVEAALAEAGVHVEVLAEVEGLLALRSAVAAGWGPAFLPRRAWEGPRREVAGLSLSRRFTLVLPPKPSASARRLRAELLG